MSIDSPPRSPKQQRTGWIVGIALALLAAGGAAAYLLNRPTTTAPTQTVAPTAQTVTVAPVQTAPISRSIQATGTVAARDLLPIAAQATGLQVQQVLTDEGQQVKRGQTLAILNGDVLRSQLAQAQAQLASSQAVQLQRQAALQQQQATLAEAQSNVRRYQQLAKAGAISQADLQQRTTAAATAQAAVATAQAAIGQALADERAARADIQRLQTQLNQTIVRSPADGTISERLARVGDTASAANPLFRLIRNGDLELQVRVPETELPQIRPGESVRITSDADPRINYQGTVRSVAPLVDPQTRLATVKINLPQNPAIRSGLFLRATIITQSTQGLTVPAKAVLSQTDGARVFVLQPDNTVRSQVVQTGTTVNNNPNNPAIEITKGLRAGDRVVVSGAGYLKDGDRVVVAQQ